jgi:hypothetical protein
MSNGVACSHGCFCCSQAGDGRYQEHSGGCCHSTLCDSHGWENQVREWITAEKKWKREHDPEITRWLIAETLWKAAVPAWLAAEQEWGEQLTLWLEAKEEFRQQLREKQREVMATRVAASPRKGRAKQTSATVAAQVALQKAGHGVSQ